MFFDDYGDQRLAGSRNQPEVGQASRLPVIRASLPGGSECEKDAPNPTSRFHPENLQIAQ
jgi:hypothetical protein